MVGIALGENSELMSKLVLLNQRAGFEVVESLEFDDDDDDDA